MKSIQCLVAVVLAFSLTGAATPITTGPDPRDPYPIEGPKPTCLGKNGHYHVWNLFAPQEVYQVDSCIATQLVAARNAATNYAMYLSLLLGKVPAFVPLVVFVMAWQTGNMMLSQCASKGTGIEFVQDSRTGAVVYCRAQ